MDYLKKKLTNKNFLVIAVIILSSVSFLLARSALAGVSDAIGSAVLFLTGWFIQILVDFFGNLLLISISILIKICSFNEFVDADIVTLGWVIIRDLANLGIVIAMLIIAFGTTINKKAYHYQSMLPKLIFAAILVNFSKEITGALISFSQYIMMYFVHAFENIAAGNITYGLGIDDMLSVRKTINSVGGGVEINDWNVLGALILATVMLAVALGVILTMAIMLLYRIVYLWMLIIFSPIYFLADLLPATKSYAGQWKSALTDNLVKGPTLAFMFWLSMTFLSQITDQNRLISLQMQAGQANGTLSVTDYTYFASKMSSPQRVFDYLVTVILFIFTMGVAKKAGGLAGTFAAAYSGRLNKVGKWFRGRAIKGTKAVGVTGAVGGLVGGPLGLAGAMALRSFARKKMAKSNVPVLSQIAKDRQEVLDDRRQAGAKKILGKIGLGENTADLLNNILDNNVGRFVFGGTQRAARQIAGAARTRRLMTSNLNNPIGNESRDAWDSISAPYSGNSGIDNNVEAVLANLGPNAVAGLRTLITQRRMETRTQNGVSVQVSVPVLSDGRLSNWQRAMQSYIDGGGDVNAGEVQRIIQTLDQEANARNATNGNNNLQHVQDYHGRVAYSKTNMNDLMQHNQMKQAFEEFKLENKDQNLNEEDLRQKFFSSERAQQAYRQGNRDIGEFVNEATSQGVSSSGLEELGVQNLSVRSGQTQFQEPTEMPSAEQLRAEFERTEEEIRRLAEATHEGVTVGQYGRREGENTLAVGFDELNEYMNRNNLGHVVGLEDKTSEGVMVENVEQVRQGLSGMIQEQLNSLKNAKTNEEKIEALKSFGIQTDKDNPKLETLIERAENKATVALDKLQNKDLVDDEGLVLVNKNRVSGTAREVIRHEDAHNIMRQNDEDGEIRRDLADSLSQEMRTRIDSHLHGRSDYNQLSDTQRFEEYAADVVGRRVQDPEFIQLLADSGLLNRNGQAGQIFNGGEITPINIQGVSVSPQVREAVSNSGILDELRPLLQLQKENLDLQLQGQTKMSADFEKNRAEWKLIRTGIQSLSTLFEKNDVNIGLGLDKIKQQLKSLDRVLPHAEATSLEVKAALQKNNISTKDLKNFLSSFAK